jgi:hypothetical protein
MRVRIIVDWVRKALTRKLVRHDSRGRQQEFEVPPRDELIYGVKFAIGMTVCLSAIEIANMAFLNSWNSEVFSVIASLVGFVTCILVGSHASRLRGIEC